MAYKKRKMTNLEYLNSVEHKLPHQIGIWFARGLNTISKEIEDLYEMLEAVEDPELGPVLKSLERYYKVTQAWKRKLRQLIDYTAAQQYLVAPKDMLPLLDPKPGTLYPKFVAETVEGEVIPE